MKKINQKNIETTRLLLRTPEISDAHFMYYNWASDPEVTKYLSWSPHESISVSELLIHSWINNDNSVHWIIESKKTKEAIGSISIFNLDYNKKQCEIGYCLSRFYWNQGLMTECIAYLINYIFKSKMRVITALVQKENLASIRVLEKNNMQLVEELPANNEINKPILIYKITKEA